MRLLLMCSAYPPNGRGGGPVSSQLIAEGLAKQGHIVRVITVADAAFSRIENGVEIKTIKSLNIYWNYWISHSSLAKLIWHLLENGNPRAYFKMREEIRAFNPDAVFTISIENINVATWLAAHLERVPVVHVSFSYFAKCWRGSQYKNNVKCSKQCFDCKVLSIGKRYLSRLVDGFAAETNFVLDDHRNAGYFPNAITRKIPGSIAMLPDSTAAALKQEKNTGVVVGYIGVHTPNKGLNVLARAAKILQNEKQITFLIAGEGNTTYSKEVADEFLGTNCIFLGWVKPDEFYRRIDILVVPSLWDEPFGRVSVEAQAYGIPVVSADSGGLPENVKDGVTGFIYKSNDPGALASNLLNLCHDLDLRKLMSQNAKMLANDFSVARAAIAYTDFVIDVRSKVKQ